MKTRLLHSLRLRALDLADLVLGRRDSLVPPRLLNDAIGGFDFREVGRHLASIATEHAGLTPNSRLLDIGCGCGRLAVPLVNYLTTGEYVGFDISRRAIRWCERAIGRNHPQFWFRHVDIANSHYNPRGRLPPEAFRFPCADSSVDVAFAASVFTHLQPGVADHYFAETARVLKSGGRAAFSFYLVEPANLARLPNLWPKFAHLLEPSCYVVDIADPEAAVAYEREKIRSAIERHGLAVSQIVTGQWSGGPSGLSFQDFVFARRGDRARQPTR